LKKKDSVGRSAVIYHNIPLRGKIDGKNEAGTNTFLRPLRKDLRDG